MRLSYSSISTYRTCPLQYKFIEVDKMPRKRTAALDFGSSLHSALQFLYSVPEPPAPSLDEILANLEKVWENEGYENAAEEKRHLAQAKQVLTDYYAANIDGKDFLVPLAVEHYFRIPFEDIEVSGRIDRIDKLPDSTYEIIDYKTNRRLPDLIQLESDLQLSMYHWAAEATWGITPDKLTLYFLLHNQSLTTSRRPEQIERAQETVRQTLAGITGGDFEPKKNPLCPWCDFQDKCPYFAEEYKEPAGAQLALKVAEEERHGIELTTDEYIELKKKEKDIRDRLFELQAIIHRYCEEHGVSEIVSKKGIITRAAREQLKLDEARLREILEPLQLWEKVLKVDKTQVEELLKSGTLSVDVKNAIEAVFDVESITHALYLKEASEEES